MSRPTRRVGLIIGSLRRESINRKLAHALVRIAPEELSFVEISLADLPMYNGDLEDDRPEPVRRFTDQVREVDALLIVMPEYNRSVPAVLKNAIDWGSKPMHENVWRNKPVVITGTSPGAIGTAVGQQHLRQILGILGASVLGGEAYIRFVPDLLDDQGGFTDPSTEQFLADYLEQFAIFTAKLLAA